jgi:uncharacterized protein YceH (UPF0502 family)
VLLLRGAQTPGELRTRTSRLCRFDDVQQAEAVLERLMEREDGPFVARLPREPGKRESRYVQLFSEAPKFTEAPVGREVTAADKDAERLDRLEQQVGELFREVKDLRERLDGLAAE